MKRLFTILILAFVISKTCYSQSQGPLTPSTYTTLSTGAGWGNLMGVQFVDNSPAYVDLAQFPTCNSFMCYYSNVASFTGFGFSIPTAATITGIQLDILQRVSSPGGGIHDDVLSLALNNAALGNNVATSFNWLSTPQVQTYGGSTNTMGYAWTAAQVNDPAFGLVYKLTNSSYDQTASVDHLTMTVYYQTGTGLQSQTSTPWQIGFNGSQLLINAESSNLAQATSVTVNSMNGSTVFQYNHIDGSALLDLKVDASNWNAGIYVVSIQPAAGKIFQQKVVLIK